MMQELFIRQQREKKLRSKARKLLKSGKNSNRNVWKATIPNSFFGDYNPYKDLIAGDWFSDMGQAFIIPEKYILTGNRYGNQGPLKGF